MVCPYCLAETQVINSRPQKRNNQVWRRRRCVTCGAVFTTHEAIDLSSSFSVSKGGKTAPFMADKLFKDVMDKLKGNQRPYETAREITATITHKVLKDASNGLISSQAISRVAAVTLKNFDHQAYLRYIADHPSAE